MEFPQQGRTKELYVKDLKPLHDSVRCKRPDLWKAKSWVSHTDIVKKMPEKLHEYDLEKVPKVVYHPKYEETPLERFKKMVAKKFKLKFNDYWEFHEWSYTNYPEFWDCVWHFFDVVYSKPYSQDDLSVLEDGSRWPGGKVLASEPRFQILSPIPLKTRCVCGLDAR
ncbi:hypothetical protein AVEN_164222-1 [Araneus ventricosus]|uniref:Acetoacetyl-CoA synthetase n=1 Tax=Araneus ventricosus TaxID=182803 RepID=A0A4Y2LTW0_ARAVE|nr:hypothetical protein AVEN_164222-1 [Araneus ventricosus]